MNYELPKSTVNHTEGVNGNGAHFLIEELQTLLDSGLTQKQAAERLGCLLRLSVSE